MVVDDALLAQRCLANDSAAIQEMVARYQADVFGLCCRLLGHRHDAEDVTQEVFLRIFRSLRGWDSTRPLKPWILGIAVNRCRTWLGQRSKRPELLDHLQETVAAREVDDASELLSEIRAGLAEMRLDYRTVFVLFHEQGQPYEEIAQALERPVGTIKTWLHRARQELLERLRQRGLVATELDEVPQEPLPSKTRGPS